MPFPKPEPIDTTSPSQDRTGRHARDAWLRSQGFRIFRRPKKGEAMWERGWRVYREAELLGAFVEGRY